MSRSLLGSAADPGLLKRVKDRDKAARDQAAADLRILMASPAGRRFVWGVLDRCHVNATTAPPDAWMAVREGERRVGLWLQDRIMMACPADYQLMFVEAWTARMSRALTSAPRKDGEDDGTDDDESDE